MNSKYIVFSFDLIYLVHEWWVEYIYVDFVSIRTEQILAMTTTNWQWTYLNMKYVDISLALIRSLIQVGHNIRAPQSYINISLVTCIIILPSQVLISAVTKLIALTEHSTLHYLFSGHPLAGLYVNNVIICVSTSENKNYA